MENKTQNPDLVDVLVSISCLKDELAELGTDPTPRMIRWGLSVIDLQGNGRNVRRGLSGKTQEQQWARVRAYLSPKALNILKGILETLQEDLGKQLTIGEIETCHLPTQDPGSLEGLQRVSARADSPIDLQTRLSEVAAALGKDGETGPVCD